MSRTVKILYLEVVNIIRHSKKRGGSNMNTNEYDESWLVYVPSDQSEQDNIDALDEYLDNMYQR